MTAHDLQGPLSVLNIPHGRADAALRTIRMFYFDAGGGHRSAATALRTIIADGYPDWHAEPVNLFEDILRPLDPMRRLGDYNVEDLYNAVLKRGWTYGFKTMLNFQHKLIRLRTPAMEILLEEYWRSVPPPELAVSLVPLFNGVLFNSLRRVYPWVPAVTVMTDIADCPPNFWQSTPDRAVICGSERALRQAKTAGYKPENVFSTSGMILKPQFYAQPAFDKKTERRKLGLDPDRPTAIVMFGGNGARMAAGIVTRLARSKPKIQCIVLCGRDEKLRKRLARRKSCLAVGFTADRVPYYMALADFFIGKPGPGSLSEALHMGLPVIVEYNRRTMPQERYNVVWIRQNKLGIPVTSFRRMAPAMRQLLTGGRLEKYRDNAARLRNRALYEIPAIFGQLMDDA